jgi:hypothetical protein
MAMKLDVMHGSHPCAAVERGLELEALAWRRVELIPPMHAVTQRIMFGGAAAN